ncbi:polysaccharide biosynthesis protein [Thermogutta sp.]|uniref:polysaccharide biosynthesis protein n=1 Tax=Thermogutta sp. TaxID=1962930 RepID=UPI003C7AB19E
MTISGTGFGSDKNRSIAPSSRAPDLRVVRAEEGASCSTVEESASQPVAPAVCANLSSEKSNGGRGKVRNAIQKACCLLCEKGLGTFWRIHFLTSRPAAPVGWGKGLVGVGVLIVGLVASYLCAFHLRFDGLGQGEVQRWFWTTLPYVVAIKLLVFVSFGVHRSWTRFLSFYDLLVLVEASTAALAAVVIFDRFLLPPRMVPRGILLIDWGTTLLILGGVRAIVRAIRDRTWQNFFSNDPPVFIVGADEAGEDLLRAINRHSSCRYRVVGFIDRQAGRVGTRIGGVPVIGTLEQTCELARRLGVKDIFLAGGSLSGREIRRLMEEARESGIHVQVLPSYEQLLSGRVAVQPRPIAITDLLRRDPVALEWENLRHWLEDRVLLVTGSAGSIGSEIARQLVRFRPRCLVLVDRSETGQFFLERELRQLAGTTESARRTQLAVLLADVLDFRRMDNLFAQYRPDVVFHAAAYKHVPLLETHPGEAVKNIIFATRNVADLAHQYGAESFVMISTDKAVNPTSVMGACKRVAEMYVQSMREVSACRFVTVRFGNVLDSAGSVVQIFRQQIAEGGPVTVTDPRMERFFMTIPEAAGLVIQAGVIGESGQIMVLDMGEPVRIMDLAVDMIRLSGLEVGRDIEIEVIGLRPGEKLLEELQAADERTIPTRHDKIRVAVSPRVNREAILRAIDRLSRLLEVDDRQIITELQQIVPHYRPHGQPESPALRRAA